MRTIMAVVLSLLFNILWQCGAAGATEAEVALRREALINARSARDTGRLNLLRLVNPPGSAALGREISITDEPALPAADPAPIEDHVALALRLPFGNSAPRPAPRGPSSSSRNVIIRRDERSWFSGGDGGPDPPDPGHLLARHRA